MYDSMSFRLTCKQACSPMAISVLISASFFWMSWVLARGFPNCFRSNVYWRAASRQNSAAPKAPQAIPYRALFKHPNGPVKDRIRVVKIVWGQLIVKFLMQSLCHVNLSPQCPGTLHHPSRTGGGTPSKDQNGQKQAEKDHVSSCCSQKLSNT